MRDMKAPTQTLTGYANVSQNAPINLSMRCGPVTGIVAVRTPPSLGEEAGGTGRRAKALCEHGCDAEQERSVAVTRGF